MTSAPQHPSGDPGVGDVTWTRFLIAVLKYPRTLVAVPALLVIAIVGLALVLPRPVSVASTFLPERASRQSEVGALAAQFGFDVQTDGADSPDFYADLLHSQQLLKEAALTTYRFPIRPGATDTLQGTIIDLYEIKGQTENGRVLGAIKTLENLISVRTDRLTSVVTLQATTKWLGLSQQLNQRLLDLTNQFNIERRQSRAAVERRFVEGRLREAQDELRAAETALEQFWARNRGFASSQQLRFEASRLQRQVDLRQEVYVTLSRSYEQARIEEVRNTPVITVIDPPEYPVPIGGRLVRRGFMGLFAGVGLAVGLALLMEFLGVMRTRRPGDFAEMERLARSALAGFVPGRARRRPAEM
jgi:uncharacterized protein involved in exopolysaccharide biosynthesis